MGLSLHPRVTDFAVALVAVFAGAAVVYAGDRALGVTLEHFYGVATFSPAWVLDLFLVPFIAGIVVSAIYGLGGKMWAHLSPVIVRLASYYEAHQGALPDGAGMLPMSYWLLIVIVAAEFAAFGGVVGEIIVKRTYGRTPRERLHRKYQDAQKAKTPAGEAK